MFLNAGDFVAVNLQHAVHHQKRIAVRQNLHHLLRVHRAALRHLRQQCLPLLVILRGRNRRRRERLRGAQRLGHLRDNLPDELAIRRVARLDRDQMPANRPAQQRQIAHDVQHLVPHEFLRIPQRLGRQHRVVADDNGVLQAAALDEAVLDEVFNLLVKAKRPRVRQFLFPRLGRDFRAVKLREPALLVRARAGDFETVVGKQRHHRLARFQFNRRGWA